MHSSAQTRKATSAISLFLIVTTLFAGCAAPKQEPPPAAAAEAPVDETAGADGRTLNELALAHFESGRHQQAADVYRRAAEVNHGSGDRDLEAAAFSGMGRAYESLKDDAQAAQAYEQSIKLLESLRSDARTAESKADASDNAALSSIYQRAARVALKAGRASESFDLSERARARNFLEQLSSERVDVKSHGDPALVAREQELRAELSTLEASLRQELRKRFTASQESIESILSITEDKRTEYSDVLTRLKRSDPEYASLVNLEPPTLTDVQGMLDARTTLLSYFVGADFTLAYVITQNKLVAKELPMGKEEIEQIVLAKEYAKPDGSLTGFNRLYRGLIAPVRSELRTPILGIIPYGALHYVPFSAFGDGGGWLGDNFSIFELPSASTLPFVQAKSNQARSSGRVRGDEMLAMAPNFPDGPFTPLLFSALETQYVSRLYGARPYFANQATEATFKALAPQSRFIHLSTHGEFNPTNPLFSRIALAAGGGEDGSLEVHEVYGLDLRKAELVVLSACETDMGDRSDGDDVVGLTRAFIYAGAPTVVSSRWEVSDLATAIFMTTFYEQLIRGRTKAEALKYAQQIVRHDYPHPYYWASFVLTGAPT
jgi:CHAT domain-containing protein